jgi:hypothetical protein
MVETSGCTRGTTKNGTVVRTGVVVADMPDQSALWLSMQGNNPRCMIFSCDGYEVWTDGEL